MNLLKQDWVIWSVCQYISDFMNIMSGAFLYTQNRNVAYDFLKTTAKICLRNGSLSLHLARLEIISVQSLSHVWLFATPRIAARQASLSITNSWSSLKLTSIESVMPSSHLILCRRLLLPPIPPSIRVFSNESTLHLRWPKYWSFSFSIIPSKEIPGWSSSEWTGWISLQYLGAQLSLWSNSHIHTWPLEKL